MDLFASEHEKEVTEARNRDEQLITRYFTQASFAISKSIAKATVAGC